MSLTVLNLIYIALLVPWMCEIYGKFRILVHQGILFLMISSSRLDYVLTEIKMAVDTFSLKHVLLDTDF